MTDKEKESYEWRRNLLLTQMRKQTDQWLKDDLKNKKVIDDNDPLPPKRGRKVKEKPKPIIDLDKPRNKFFKFD